MISKRQTKPAGGSASLLRFGGDTAGHPGGLFGHRLFLAQQASEEALKALLYDQGSRGGSASYPFPRGDGPDRKKQPQWLTSG